ncbi:MAG TPA: hypothetical protein VJO12_15775 [Stellaceae bacterium]|nr:hypothetical protein [Stellaceae bacterium]
MLAANTMVGRLMAGADAALLKPPVNVLRLSLHPHGLAPRIANLAEWRAHLLARLRRQVELSADPVLVSLLTELRGYPAPLSVAPAPAAEYGEMVVPFRLTGAAGVLSFFSTTTVFGTPVDITLAELALESFFPADAATTDALHRLAATEGAAAPRRSAAS